MIGHLVEVENNNIKNTGVRLTICTYFAIALHQLQAIYTKTDVNLNVHKELHRSPFLINSFLNEVHVPIGRTQITSTVPLNYICKQKGKT